MNTTIDNADENVTRNHLNTLRAYEAAHRVWINTSVFTGAGKEAKRVKDETREAYIKARAAYVTAVNTGIVKRRF